MGRQNSGDDGRLDLASLEFLWALPIVTAQEQKGVLCFSPRLRSSMFNKLYLGWLLLQHLMAEILCLCVMFVLYNIWFTTCLLFCYRPAFPFLCSSQILCGDITNVMAAKIAEDSFMLDGNPLQMASSRSLDAPNVKVNVFQQCGFCIVLWHEGLFLSSIVLCNFLSLRFLWLKFCESGKTSSLPPTAFSEG